MPGLARASAQNSVVDDTRRSLISFNHGAKSMVNLRRDMITGLVRLRILHAATCAAVSGVELGQELEKAGHHIGPGTLYPLLHSMQKDGWVKSTGKTVKGKRRRYYRATRKGTAQLEQALAALDQFLSGIRDPVALELDQVALRRELAPDGHGQGHDGEGQRRHRRKRPVEPEPVSDEAVAQSG
jgi:PadR family transcriptional regulator, regulatory protein PadR